MKRVWWPEIRPIGPNQAQNEFGSYDFLEIEDNDSLGQCLTSTWGKIHKKVMEPKLGQMGENQAHN